MGLAKPNAQQQQEQRSLSLLRVVSLPPVCVFCLCKHPPLPVCEACCSLPGLCLPSLTPRALLPGPRSQDEGSEGQERRQYGGEERCQGEGDEGPGQGHQEAERGREGGEG